MTQTALIDSKQRPLAAMMRSAGALQDVKMLEFFSRFFIICTGRIHFTLRLIIIQVVASLIHTIL